MELVALGEGSHDALGKTPDNADDEEADEQARHRYGMHIKRHHRRLATRLVATGVEHRRRDDRQQRRGHHSYGLGHEVDQEKQHERKRVGGVEMAANATSGQRAPQLAPHNKEKGVAEGGRRCSHHEHTNADDSLQKMQGNRHGERTGRHKRRREHVGRAAAREGGIAARGHNDGQIGRRHKHEQDQQGVPLVEEFARGGCHDIRAHSHDLPRLPEAEPQKPPIGDAIRHRFPHRAPLPRPSAKAAAATAPCSIAHSRPSRGPSCFLLFQNYQSTQKWLWATSAHFCLNGENEPLRQMNGT